MHIIKSSPIASGHIAIVQCAGTSGGRKWGQWVNLRLVKFSAEAWQKMENNEIRRLVGAKGIDVIDTDEVDAKNQGPKSRFSAALEAQSKALDAFVRREYLTAIGSASAPVPARARI